MKSKYEVKQKSSGPGDLWLLTGNQPRKIALTSWNRHEGHFDHIRTPVQGIIDSYLHTRPKDLRRRSRRSRWRSRTASSLGCRWMCWRNESSSPADSFLPRSLQQSPQLRTPAEMGHKHIMSRIKGGSTNKYKFCLNNYFGIESEVIIKTLMPILIFLQSWLALRVLRSHKLSLNQ